MAEAIGSAAAAAAARRAITLACLRTLNSAELGRVLRSTTLDGGRPCEDTAERARVIGELLFAREICLHL